MKERTVDIETAAVLRRLRRLGVLEIDWRTGPAGVSLRAKVQKGRAHRQLATGPHPGQLSALHELAGLALAVQEPKPARRQPESRRVERPEAGVKGSVLGPASPPLLTTVERRELRQAATRANHERRRRAREQ